MTFRRLTAGHALALIGALALLLVMAPDWYTDKVGEQDRFYQHDIVPQLNNQTVPSQSALQADAAEHHEKNAWQATGAIDRVILIALLAAAGLAIVAAFLRAAGRDVGPPSLSALAAMVGLVASALIAYRIINPPGYNPAAVVKWGAPLGLVCVGLVAIGSRMAMRQERERPTPAPEPGADTTAEAPATPA
jgi:hypothetical protein